MGLLDDIKAATRSNAQRLGGLIDIDSTGNGLLSDLDYAKRNALSRLKYNIGSNLDSAGRYFSGDPNHWLRQPATAESSAAIDEVLMNYGPGEGLGLAGTFISREGAKRLGREALMDKAISLHRKGVDPRTYWQETKTFVAPDGQAWMEIPDNALKMSGTPKAELLQKAWDQGGIDAVKTAKEDLKDYEQPYLQSRVRELGDVIEHPDLASIYPEIFHHSSYQMDPKLGIGEGSYNNYRRLYSIGPANEETARSVMTHELQHGVQHEEDAAMGGNPGQMPLLLRNEGVALKNEAKDWLQHARSNDPLNPGEVRKPGLHKRALEAEKRGNDYLAMADRIESMGGAFPAYENLWGEAMANLAQKRLDYSPEQRDRLHPLDDLEIDPKNAIFIRPSSFRAFKKKSLLED